MGGSILQSLFRVITNPVVAKAISGAAGLAGVAGLAYGAKKAVDVVAERRAREMVAQQTARGSGILGPAGYQHVPAHFIRRQAPERPVSHGALAYAPGSTDLHPMSEAPPYPPTAVSLYRRIPAQPWSMTVGTALSSLEKTVDPTVEDVPGEYREYVDDMLQGIKNGTVTLADLIGEYGTAIGQAIWNIVKQYGYYAIPPTVLLLFARVIYSFHLRERPTKVLRRLRKVD